MNKKTLIVGITLVIIIWGGGLWSIYNVENEVSNLDVESIRLTPFHDKAESGVIHGEIVLTVDRKVSILLEGDIVEMKFRFNSQNIVQSGEGYIFYYSGLLQLTEPKVVGDEVSIQIRHGGSETRIVAEVGGA